MKVFKWYFPYPTLKYYYIVFAIFRDVMSISKKLAKEREEMCRELRRLQDSTMELHDNMIMELQVLKEENNSLCRKDSTEADKK